MQGLVRLLHYKERDKPQNRRLVLGHTYAKELFDQCVGCRILQVDVHKALRWHLLKHGSGYAHPFVTVPRGNLGVGDYTLAAHLIIKSVILPRRLASLSPSS